MIMKIATLTTKGQVTIPAEIRALLGVDAGDRISFETQGDHVVLRALGQVSVKSVRGMFGKSAVVATIEDMHEAVRARAAERFSR